ncbi:MAG: MFS transporter [Bacteroidales bacterium]|nr:MFS transporter [Bacteroidales bacterium]MBN2698486.1 MFS transporter [Bacteroidales bacterium]
MEAVRKTLRDSAPMRWLMLVLVSMLMLSTYWFQDFFGGLKGLMESEMGFTSEEFGRLIGLTTIANIFGMIIVGGVILDKWGIRRAGIIFGSLATLGAAITALAAYGVFGDNHRIQLNMMILGRILFGSGLEVVCVVSTRTVVKWFKGYELALAMAINMGFGRLGSAMGLALSIDIGHGSVPPAVAFAATLIGISLIVFLIYTVFDYTIDKQDKKIRLESGIAEAEDDFRFADLIALVKNRSFMFIALLCVSFYAAVFPFIQYAPDLLVNKFGFSYDLPANANYFSPFGNQSLGTVSIYLGLFLFGLAFSMVPSRIKNRGWKIGSMVLIAALFVLFLKGLWGTLSIWLQNGPKTASLIPMGTILFTPIFGNYVDKKGKAASLMILGALLLIFAHISLSLFNNVVLGYFGLLSLGIAFSLVPAAMWPSVAKIVAEKRLGTAYASMFTIQNWGLLLFFWGIGAVLDLVNRNDLEAIRAGEMNYNYTIPIFMLVVLGIISIFLAFQLRKADAKQKFGLELPSGVTPE